MGDNFVLFTFPASFAKPAFCDVQPAGAMSLEMYGMPREGRETVARSQRGTQEDWEKSQEGNSVPEQKTAAADHGVHRPIIIKLAVAL